MLVYACYKQSLKSVFRVFDSRFLCSGIISLIIVKSRNILNYLIFAVTRYNCGDLGTGVLIYVMSTFFRQRVEYLLLK